MSRIKTFAATLILAVVGFATAAIAQLQPGLPVKLDDFTTNKGVRYEQAHAIRIEASGVTIAHSLGNALVPIMELPPDVLKKLNIRIVPKEEEEAEARKELFWKNEIERLYLEGMPHAEKRRFVVLQVLDKGGYLAQWILPRSSGDPNPEQRRLVYLRKYEASNLPLTREVELLVADGGEHTLETGEAIPAYFVYPNKRTL